MIASRILSSHLARLAGLGVAAIGLAAMAGPISDAYGNNGYVLCLLVAGVVTALASLVARDAPGTWAVPLILFVAIVLRLIALDSAPHISTDVYRYVWDGRVQGAGINPYLYIPADPKLDFLRDEAIYPLINRKDYAHTAYPPFAQMFFFAATRAADTLASMRASVLVLEAATVLAIYLLLRRMGRPPALIVAYAWHPMAVWEAANGGHVDALASLMVVLALLALTSARRMVGAALVACAILVKPYAAILLPAFWRPWDWRAPLLVLVVIAALYLPYLGAGTGVIGFVPEYFHEERLDSGGAFWLVQLAKFFVGDVPGLLVAYVLLGFGAFVWATLRILRHPPTYAPERQYRDAMLLLAIGIFFLSPNYPWYYLPLVPFAALGGGPAIWVMTVGALILHASLPGQDADARFLTMKTILNLSWMLALALAWATGRARRGPPERVAP